MQCCFDQRSPIRATLIRVWTTVHVLSIVQAHYTPHTRATVKASTRASTVKMVIHRQTLFYRLTIWPEIAGPEYAKPKRIKRTGKWKITTRWLKYAGPKNVGGYSVVSSLSTLICCLQLIVHLNCCVTVLYLLSSKHGMIFLSQCR